MEEEEGEAERERREEGMEEEGSGAERGPGESRED